MNCTLMERIALHHGDAAHDGRRRAREERAQRENGAHRSDPRMRTAKGCATTKRSAQAAREAVVVLRSSFGSRDRVTYVSTKLAENKYYSTCKYHMTALRWFGRVLDFAQA